MSWTEWDRQPLMLPLKDKYIANDQDGLAMMVKSKKKDEGLVEVLISTYPIMPTERIVDIETEKESTTIAFRPRKEGDQAEPWSFVTLNGAELTHGAKFAEKLRSAGYSQVTLRNAGDLIDYIASATDTGYSVIPVNKAASHFGWVENCTDFLPYSKDIKYIGDAQLVKAITSKGSLDAWKEKMCPILRRKGVANIVISASLASALVEPLGQLSAVVHTWGVTGIGKTVLAMCAASVWGQCDAGSAFIKSHNGTINSKTAAAVVLNSLPLILDEAQVSRDKDQTTEALAYAYTQGKERGRVNPDGTQQLDKYWHGVMISTGEDQLVDDSSAGGARNRVINLHLTEPFCDDVPGVADFLTENYGHVGRIAVQTLLEKTEWIDAIRKEYRDSRSEFVRQGVTGKQAASAALIKAASLLLSDAVLDVGLDCALSCDDLLPYLCQEKDIDTGKAAYEYTCGLIASNMDHFAEAKDLRLGVERWGSIEDNVISFMVPILNRELKRANPSYSATVLGQWLNSRGKLHRMDKNNRSFSINKKYDGVQVRSLVFEIENDS